MIIFYERLKFTDARSTPPYFTSKSLPILPEEERVAMNLAVTGPCLFAKVTPLPGLEIGFAENILKLAEQTIHIIPELCDDEGRTLAEKVTTLIAEPASPP